MQLLLLGALLAASAPPQDTDQVNIPHAVGRDGLLVSLVHTEDKDSFVRTWIAGTATLPITEHAVRGRRLTTIVIFQTCRAGADGHCNLTGHFTYVRPDGSVYGEVDSPLWSSAPSRDGTALPALGPDLVVDPPDPMGSWTLRVRVTDNVSHVSVDAETRFIVDTPPTAAAN